MYENFLSYFNYDGAASFSDTESFRTAVDGRTFKNGIYRLFSKENQEKWTKIVEESFPKYAGNIEVFGYDWLGRIFATKNSTSTTLMFEPGTGDVFDVPVGFAEFHDEELVEFYQDCLAANFFEEWFEKSGQYVLKSAECVGYKVPLFLNGNDDITNVEVSDMEVYWGLMGSLI
ncbi:MAG: DUF1851 domain-containing protein [Eubacteriales bacterium]